MRRIKAVVYGVGSMNSVATRMMLEKGVDIVGALARSPEKVGRDLGEVAGLGFETGVIVEDDPDRVLYPMKRSGPRGAGKWERTSWDEVLETFGSRIRKAIQEGRGEEVMYHVGRPGADFYMERTLQAWGIDGHNSHTNVCSSSARFGYILWHHADRPSPDHSNARFILLLSGLPVYVWVIRQRGAAP